MGEILLEGRGIVKTFRGGFGGRPYRALDGVSIALERGETLGLMGPSGCGKSTLARILLRLIDPDEGQLLFDGQDITALRGRRLLSLRRKVQLISQRPESSFDPHRKLGDSLRETMNIHRLPHDPARINALLEQVKLTDERLSRYPHQVSGGEIQRLSLCRALLLRPEVLVLDEPTSMLDISVQAQILQILRELRDQYALSCLFITHDRAVAFYLCERVVELNAP